MNFVIDIDKQGNGVIKSDYLDNIREYFSIKNPNARIMRAKGFRHAPERLYCITPTGRFGKGMFGEICFYIKSLKIPYTMTVTDKFSKEFKPTYPFYDYDLCKLSKKPREYQLATVKKCLKQGNGSVVIATAGGKTLTMALLIQTIRENSSKNHKTLVVVPGVQLVSQTCSDFIEYGINPDHITKWSGTNKLDSDAKIIIAGMSILTSKKTDLSILSDIDLFIGDEIHKWRKDNKINKVLKNIDTPHTYGFTGTMPDNKVDEWNIIGNIGPVLYEKTSYDLRQQKHIVDAKIKVIQINYFKKPKHKKKASIKDPTGVWEEENDFLYNHTFRNNLISNIAKNVDNNVLVLVDRIEHGEALTAEIIKKAPNKKVYFIRGSVSVDEREKIRELMENKDNVVAIAITRIFSTGINIKNLHYIIFALAGKAKIKIVQSIGRGLRQHESKIKLVIFDIADNLIYGMKHLVSRLAIYKKEKIDYDKTEINENNKIN